MICRNGALIFGVDKPNIVTGLLPTAKHFRHKGKDLIAIKHSLDATKILRNIGLITPHPFLHDGYAWPGRFSPMAHQTETADFLTLWRKAFVLNDMGCVDADTEYLSPTGWKRIADYDGGEVMQYNKDNEVATFVQPTAYIKKPCKDMLRFKTERGIDMLLSPEHRVLYVSSTGTKQVSSAGQICQRDINSKMGWSGKLLTTFSPLLHTSIPLSEADIRVMVAVIADGHFGSGTNRCAVRLKKERKIERLELLLQKANIGYDKRLDQSESGLGFTVFTFHAPTHDKEFTSFWWQASNPQLHIIVDEVFNWDGSERKAGASDFSSFSKASADFIQYACASCGRTASLSAFTRDRGRGAETEYVVHARESAALVGVKGVSSTGERRYSITPEKSTDGFKYCFAVPDTFWVMRRNGNVIVTGNTGKTAAAAWAADYLMSRGLIKRVLIICPLSVTKVWQDELFAVLPHRSIGTMVGKREKRIDILNSNPDFCVINFDGLTSLVDIKKHKSVLDGKFDLIIADEASAYRNATTDRYKALKHINVPEVRLWLMTGTPTPNAPTDAWGLVKLVAPNRVPASFKLFQETVMRQAGPYKWVPRPNAQTTVRGLMQPAVRFEKKDCLDLPEMTYNNRHVNLTQEQAKAFETMRKRMKHEEEDGATITAANAAVKIIKLQQICCGVVKDDNKLPVYLSAKPRLDDVQQLIEEAPDKVIVFAPFIFAMELLQESISKYTTCAVVNGRVPNHERAQIFSDFQRAPNPRVLIAHPAVAAHGLTLTAASTIIWYAPIYSSEQYEQANARIDRQGQKNAMTVYHIGSHPFEWAIYDVLKNKGSMQAALLNLYRQFAG